MKTSPKTEFKRLFREAFDEPAQWLDWFAENVYRDENLLTIEEDDRTASALLLGRYDMAFHGSQLPVSYISCVATAKAYRGKGLMHRLMTRALNVSAERGDALCTLIPAEDRLYFFYDRFGFATVFYIDEMRYTALHSFVTDIDFLPFEPDFDTFSRLESMRGCCVMHSRDDFANIVHDIRFDGGRVLGVRAPEGRAAIAFVTIGESATVKDLLATDSRAEESVMAAVRAEVGDKPIIVWGRPDGRRAMLRSRGMARIVNVASVLSALAESDRRIDQVIRVHDPIIAANNGIYIVRDGECIRTDSTMRRITLDVSADVLARIIFSTPAIADIFGLPGGRPMMSLMLD